MAASTAPREVKIKAGDLPFACPPPKAPHWQLHPRVFIQISARQPRQTCPYCGTLYILETASPPDDDSTAGR